MTTDQLLMLVVLLIPGLLLSALVLGSFAKGGQITQDIKPTKTETVNSPRNRWRSRLLTVFNCPVHRQKPSFLWVYKAWV